MKCFYSILIFLSCPYEIAMYYVHPLQNWILQQYLIYLSNILPIYLHSTLNFISTYVLIRLKTSIEPPCILPSTYGRIMKLYSKFEITYTQTLVSERD